MKRFFLSIMAIVAVLTIISAIPPAVGVVALIAAGMLWGMLEASVCYAVGRTFRDSFGLSVSVPPQVITADVAVTTWIDTRDYDAATFLAISGAIVAAGLVLPVAQDADDSAGTGAADVAAANLEGAFTNMAASSTQRVGYKGTKRWIGIRFDYISGTSIAASGVVALNYPHQQPVA